MKFSKYVLIQGNFSFKYKIGVNIYLVYELNDKPSKNFFTKIFLFGAIRLTRNSIKNKFLQYGHLTAFDAADYEVLAMNWLKLL